MNSLNKKQILNIGIVVAAVISLSIVYFAGFQVGYAETKNIEVTGIKNGNTPESINADFSVFWQAWNELKAKHIHGKDVDARKMVEGAIEGLTNSFDDPYTVYFNPKDSKSFNEEVSGHFGGIGAEIGIRNDQLIIIAPLKDTPAERADLRAKDQIIEINGESTQGLTTYEAVKMIRGEIGTKVVLTILREGWEKVEKIEIIRQDIQVPTVEYKLTEDKILHLNLYQFNSNAESQFARAITNGLSQGAKGLILDLRNNPGGYLDVAVSLAGWFMNSGSVVVRQKSTLGAETLLRAEGNEQLKDFPVVVLINEGSASASEILAGALRDNRGIKLVGIKTFGKGTVQQLEPLKDGSTLKITIANWLLPSGLLIEKNGIEPDVKVILDEDKFKADETDTQLEKAIEVLKTQI